MTDTERIADLQKRLDAALLLAEHREKNVTYEQRLEAELKELKRKYRIQSVAYKTFSEHERELLVKLEELKAEIEDLKSKT